MVGVVLDHLPLYGRPEGQDDHERADEDHPGDAGVLGVEHPSGHNDHEDHHDDLGKEPSEKFHDFLPEITFTQSKRAASCPFYETLSKKLIYIYHIWTAVSIVLQ